MNLNLGVVIPHPVTARDLEEARAYIAASVAGMRAPLRDPARNVALEDDFSRVNDPAVCGGCKFFSVCLPEVPYGTGGAPATALAL